jgi:phospholipid/cholesterol/gamma-HCH transport system permease protein
MSAAGIAVATRADGARSVALRGRWTLAAIGGEAAPLARELARHSDAAETSWDCLAVEALDSAGAMLLWRAWGRRLPARLSARPEQLRVFERIRAADAARRLGLPPRSPFEWLIGLGAAALGAWRQLLEAVALVGCLALDVLHLLRAPAELPWREITARIYKGGVRAMPVTALVGFLIGVVLSYLSALQLKLFGADIYIVNIVGMGVIRELGPLLVAVLVAGRSGSAMTAQLGVMRVTEEIDALAAMGVPISLRLVFPKVVALAVAMPLLVLWATAIALVGGMVTANLQLGIAYGFFIDTLSRVVPIANVWIALGKGVLFGISIALVASHFGLRARPNTESLAANTTASVVAAITLVIVLDAILAVLLRDIGLPRL